MMFYILRVKVERHEGYKSLPSATELHRPVVCTACDHIRLKREKVCDATGQLGKPVALWNSVKEVKNYVVA